MTHQIGWKCIKAICGGFIECSFCVVREHFVGLFHVSVQTFHIQSKVWSV